MEQIDKIDAAAKSCCKIHPSRTKSKPLSLHCPIGYIHFFRSGVREQIDLEIKGLVVENSEEGVYRGLKWLLLDKELRCKFSNALQGFEYDNTCVYRDNESLFFPKNERCLHSN